MRTAYTGKDKVIHATKIVGLKEELTRELRFYVLRMCNGNRSHAARILGETARGLRLNLIKYDKQGYDVPGYEACTPMIDYGKIDAAMDAVRKILGEE